MGLTLERSGGRRFAAPGCQQLPDLLPEFLCMNPGPQTMKMSSQRANNIAGWTGGLEHLLDRECPLERNDHTKITATWRSHFST